MDVGMSAGTLSCSLSLFSCSPRMTAQSALALPLPALFLLEKLSRPRPLGGRLSAEAEDDFATLAAAAAAEEALLSLRPGVPFRSRMPTELDTLFIGMLAYACVFPPLYLAAWLYWSDTRETIVLWIYIPVLSDQQQRIASVVCPLIALYSVAACVLCVVGRFRPAKHVSVAQNVFCVFEIVPFSGLFPPNQTSRSTAQRRPLVQNGAWTYSYRKLRSK